MSRRLRIVVPRFGGEVIGGIEELTRRIAVELASRQWMVEVFATRAQDESTWSGALPEHEDEDGVTVRRFPVARTRHPRVFQHASRLFFRAPAPIRPEQAWLRAQGPYSPALIRALRSAPHMPTLFAPYLYHPIVIGLPRMARPRILMPAAHDEGPLYLRAIGRLVAAADAVWYSTPEEQALLERAQPVARSRPSAVGTVGVATSTGVAARFRAATGIEDPFLLYGGRVTAGKGTADLLEGFQRLRSEVPDVRLVVAGGAHIEEAGGVVALGRLDDAAWRDALAAATAVVVPSALESLSLLALQAWAEGRPCLVNGGSAVLRGHAARSGAALTFAGPDELAAAARALLTDPSRATRMGDAGRAYVAQRYTWDQVVDRLDGLIGSD